MRKRILITGGSGFIGSHLCELLLKQNHEVICVDNFFTGSKDNIQPLLDYSGFEWIRHDIVNPLSVEVDEIYNLACPASPVHYQYNAIKTIKTNVIGTLNMLGLAKRVKAKFLQASTSEVYGDPLEHPQKESYWGNVNPIGYRSCYDEGKRVAESLTMDYHRDNSIDTRIIRIFNTYGPRMLKNDGRVVSNFIVQALEGKDITVYGDGLQTRSFCYVSDLINGIVATMDCDHFFGPVNLGNDREFTILQLAQMVIEMTGSKSQIIYKELPTDDPVRRKPDLSLASKKLGFDPKVLLEEGLKKTIEYFQSIL